MMSFNAVIALIRDLEAGELRRWIDERWVRPEMAGDGYVFHEIDVARIRLIVDLRHNLAIDEEALPVILNLLDQLYTVRRRMRVLSDAIEAQPETVRQAVRRHIGAHGVEE